LLRWLIVEADYANVLIIVIHINSNCLLLVEGWTGILGLLNLKVVDRYLNCSQSTNILRDMIPPTRNYASSTKSVMLLDIAVIQMLIQKKTHDFIHCSNAPIIVPDTTQTKRDCVGQIYPLGIKNMSIHILFSNWSRIHILN
jgi:hypothetical protein